MLATKYKRYLFAQLYSYIRLGKTAFVQSIPSLALGVEDKSDPSGYRDDKTAYKQELAALLDTAKRLRLREESEVPSEQGVCIEGGFIVSPLQYQRERITAGFRFPEYPDVSFSIETRSVEAQMKTVLWLSPGSRA